MRKISISMLLIFAFSNCGVSGTTKQTCESDAGMECNCDDQDVHTLAPETQPTVICGEGTHLEGDKCVANEVEGLDQDGDGFPYPEDCDDRRIDVNPEAEEICDNRDNDCDGEVDGEEICLYECTNDISWCDETVYEDQVSITLKLTENWYPSFISMSGCRPNSLRVIPIFLEPPNSYYMKFNVKGFEPGDVIERFVIRQTAGEIPLPSSWWDTGSGGALGNLEVYGFSHETLGNHTNLYQTHQDEEGNFVFENITIPDGYLIQSLKFRMPVTFDYTGYLQLGFMEASDFQVSNKSTITQRCEFPQQGEYVMILCPDKDNDGEDDEKCGGTDPDDEDSLPKMI